MGKATCCFAVVRQITEEHLSSGLHQPPQCAKSPFQNCPKGRLQGIQKNHHDELSKEANEAPARHALPWRNDDDGLKTYKKATHYPQETTQASPFEGG